MKTLEVEVGWSRVESVPGKMWLFPGGISRHMDKHYGGPAVYRWCVRQPRQTEPHLIYVGETGSLTERIRKIVKPPRQGEVRRTNARLNRLLNLRIEPDERIRKKLIASGVKPKTANDMIKVIRP